ncbi:DNA-3-methyladenine glycosylase [Fodinisporobacter ferrooxydans]|uniref:DNA-3-methyladenine glycosylase II n=1 Tax=Fodinisporobacter ferrooxydans TaxID=2901836 RepID=A0ABY4CHP2_9BACL|nr:DNA-3-methyladenine glycosylase [Alicyclobacillaceae bacterium MYW30-H2]
MVEYLVPAAPFDFQRMLQRPLSRPSKVTVIDLEAASYTRALRLKAKVVPITVSGGGTVDVPVLSLSYPDDLSEQERVEIRNRTRRMFSIEQDLTDFYATMSQDPRWASLIERQYGLRPIQDINLFESMVKVIIGQQLNVQFAATLVERLVDLGEETMNWNNGFLPVFPSAEQVASWSYEQLRAQSFSQRKAEYVIDFARTIVSGKIDLERLWHMSDQQILEELTALRGIGRWTVECFLLFGMGKPDVLPAADIGVQNAVQKLYGLSQRPKEDKVRQLAEAWAPWRSYATYYLWQSLIGDN